MDWRVITVRPSVLEPVVTRFVLGLTETVSVWRVMIPDVVYLDTLVLLVVINVLLIVKRDDVILWMDPVQPVTKVTTAHQVTGSAPQTVMADVNHVTDAVVTVLRATRRTNVTLQVSITNLIVSVALGIICVSIWNYVNLLLYYRSSDLCKPRGVGLVW